MGLPLDAVSVGHWLIYSQGPMTKKLSIFGTIESINREGEGLLSRVLAISAPFVFLQVYPIPYGDITSVPPLPITTIVKWSTVEFIRPSRGYLRLYLKLLRQRTKRSTRTRTLSLEAKTLMVIDPWSHPES